ncbi:MAG: hypothetical protein GY834_09805 [Bacteroidetes bacterium]|nr:hypothetical protein [Bacteroidota bacterium]
MKNLTKTKWHYALTLVLISAFTIFSSCNKNDDTFRESNLENLDDALDQSFAAELFDEIIELSDEALDFTANSELKSTGMGGGHHFMRMGDCATITKDTVNESVVTTIDFGEEGCAGQDGRERKGMMIITKTGDYWDGVSTTTYEFDNYFVNGNQLNGTKIMTGFINDAGNRQMDIVDNGVIILADDEGTISWTAQRTREVIEGSDTHMKQDDVVRVTGSSTGIAATGDTFSSEIISPLIRKMTQDCHKFYVQGIVHIVKDDGTEITTDYGDGTCDNLAEVTINGEVEIVELKGRRCRKS